MKHWLCFPKIHTPALELQPTHGCLIGTTLGCGIDGSGVSLCMEREREIGIIEIGIEILLPTAQAGWWCGKRVGSSALLLQLFMGTLSLVTAG